MNIAMWVYDPSEFKYSSVWLSIRGVAIYLICQAYFPNTCPRYLPWTLYSHSSSREALWDTISYLSFRPIKMRQVLDVYCYLAQLCMNTPLLMNNTGQPHCPWHMTLCKATHAQKKQYPSLIVSQDGELPAATLNWNLQFWDCSKYPHSFNDFFSRCGQ